MKSLNNYLNENNKQWIAISVTTDTDHYHDREVTSERVVSYDTYIELKNKGYTKGLMKIKSINTISPICKTKEQAMGYLTQKTVSVRKSKIDKGNADYVVWAINMGKFQTNGKTKFDWNIWEVAEDYKSKSDADMEIYMGRNKSFLWGAKDSLKEGDKIFVVDNDSQKCLPGAPAQIIAVFPASSKQEFVDAFRSKFPEECGRPTRAFGKISDGLPWNRFGQIYSIKGVAEDA